jgi:hypothetical protein
MRSYYELVICRIPTFQSKWHTKLWFQHQWHTKLWFQHQDNYLSHNWLKKKSWKNAYISYWSGSWVAQNRNPLANLRIKRIFKWASGQMGSGTWSLGIFSTCVPGMHKGMVWGICWLGQSAGSATQFHEIYSIDPNLI